MKKGRKKDHVWQIVRYKGDIGLYARCKCGYCYHCSQFKIKEDGSPSFEQEITKLYNYCPNCGARKKWYNDNIIKINKYTFE